MLKLVIIGVIFIYVKIYDSSKNVDQISDSKTEKNCFFLQPPLINKFPAPDGASRGLCFDGNYLWCSNSGDGNSQYGAKIYKLNPNNGTVINSYSPPGMYPNGLAWDGEYLWHSDHGTNMIYKIDPNSMSVIKSFSANFPFDLAFDGIYLYYVKGNTPYIIKIDTATGNKIDSIYCNYSSPNVRPFGLEYFPFSSPQLWTSDGNYGSNYVNEYDFSTGSWFYQWIGNPTVYPCGLAYDPVSGYLWISCWTKDSIYVYNVGSYTRENFKKREKNLTQQLFLKNNLIINLDERDKIEIILSDIRGRVIFKQVSNSPTIVKITTSNLKKGIYFLKLSSSNNQNIFKLIK
ncbi:MAG: T9SS type A sorting domain-containing protein [candidate division WOR-3 bacterium]